MPTLPNMSLITPTPGGDSGTWDDKINAAFVLVDAHDHTSGKGVQIASAAININADLAWGGFGITALGRLTFSAIAEPASGSLNLFVNTADSELYWRSSAGTNVKLTSGATINTSLVGGIGGDYSTVGAEVAFNDADQVYTFKDQSAPTKKWARLASGPVRIYENDSTESVYVEHAIDSTLASSYTVTWPAALPSATGLVRISSAGAVTFGATVTDQIPAAAANGTSGTNHTFSSNAWVFSTGAAVLGASNGFFFPLSYPVGTVITAITVQIAKNSNTSTTITMDLAEASGIGPLAAVSTFADADTSDGTGAQTLSGTGSVTIEAGKQYVIRVYNNNMTPNLNDRVYFATVTHT